MTIYRNSRSTGNSSRKNRNHTLILIISCACILLIGIGLYGVMRSEPIPTRGLNPGSDGIPGPQGEKEPFGNSDSASLNPVAFGDLTHVVTPDGIPSQEKDYIGFRVSFNSRNHTPNWVSWELLESETNGTAPRSNTFWADSEIEGTALTSDYRNSGYDRGHLCPAADQKWSSRAMEDCFVLSNMIPQDHALNTGAWNTLEKKERQWAQRDSALVIVAGPIYNSSDTKRVGTTGVRVPGACFKVFLAPYLPQPRAIGFVYPNMSAPGDMRAYSMTVREVEKITGLDFFSALPDSIEEAVETTVHFDDWANLRKNHRK